MTFPLTFRTSPIVLLYRIFVFFTNVFLFLNMFFQFLIIILSFFNQDFLFSGSMLAGFYSDNRINHRNLFSNPLNLIVESPFGVFCRWGVVPSPGSFFAYRQSWDLIVAGWWFIIVYWIAAVFRLVALCQFRVWWFPNGHFTPTVFNSNHRISATTPYLLLKTSI